MRKIILINPLLFCLIFSAGTLSAQEKTVGSDDTYLKDSLYFVNKVKVLNYSLKEFDQLFFEFSQKKSDPKINLSKKEFYSYTIKIAIFSDRLAALYPEQKKMAEESKKKWFSESYEEYALSKASANK